MGIYISDNKDYIISTLSYPAKLYLTQIGMQRKAAYIIQAWWIKYNPKKIDNYYTNDYYKIE
jgi:hypothetical protein